MRAQRRTSFAAPFVMVVGCSGAAVPPAPPPLRPEPQPVAERERAPIEESTEEPVDAAVPCMPSEIECDNCDIDVFKDGKAALGRVVEVQRIGMKMRVVVEVPKSVGIEPFRWRAHFVDDKLNPIGRDLRIEDGGGGGFAVLIDEACQLPSLRLYAWQAPPPRPPTSNPPRPPTAVDARVIGLTVSNSGSVITIAIGSAKGVTEQSHIELNHIPCAISNVTDRTTTCRVELTPDQVKTSGTTVRVTF